jgi:hypothetical protein
VLGEQRRRVEAEASARPSQLNTIHECLRACYELSLAIEVVTDPSLITQGDRTKPAGRLFP